MIHRIVRAARAAPALVGVAAVLAPPASGQVLQGTVLEEGSGRPVVGAMVRLVRDDGRPGPPYLTAADGRYRLEVPGGAAHVLLVERIGFETTRVGPVDVAATGVTVHDVRVVARPVPLEGLAVEARGGRCETGAETAAATQRLWDEARKGLALARLSEAESSVQFRLRSRARRLDPSSGVVVAEDRSTRSTWAGNPVRSLPPGDLAADGYVRSGPDGSVAWFAPDASVLLSDEFQERHCFGVTGDPVAPHLLGLTFEPVAGDGPPDIEGTLWMDAASGRLDRLEFTYTGLPDGPGEGLAGGEIRFTELGDGRWIVSDWFIQAPVMSAVRGAGPRGTFRRRMLAGIAERGTEVLWARGPGVDWAASRPTSTLRGTAWDSIAGRPLAGADVRLAGRGWRTRTDAEGAFELRDVVPGRYRLTLDHPRLEELGIGARAADVALEPGAVAEAHLALPGRATLAAERCDGGPAVVGRVLDERGSAVPGAAVRATAARSGEAPAPDPAPRADADRDGWFALCGLAPGSAVRVVGRIGPVGSAPVELAVPGAGWVRGDVTVEAGRAVAGADRVGPAAAPAVWGVVVANDDDRPLADVLVALVDEAGERTATTLSDARGRFRLPVGRGERPRVRAEVLGYGTLLSDPLDVGPRGRGLELRLSPAAIDVEGVVVEVENRVRALELAGFYERRTMTNGRFLDLEDIELNRPMHTSDLLLRLPLVERLDAASQTGNTTARYIQFRAALRRAGTNANQCLPAIYVDGVPVRRAYNGQASPDAAGIAQLDDLVTPADIEALEIYDSPLDVPVEFAGGGQYCGVIVVWTHPPGRR